MDKLTSLLLNIFVASLASEQAFYFTSFTEKGTLSIPGLIGLPVFLIATQAILVRRHFRSLTTVHNLAFIYFSFCALSFLWTLAERDTIKRMITFAQIYAMMVIIWNFSNEKREVRGLLTAYLIGAVVAATNVFVNWGLGRSLQGSGRYANEGSDPNELAVTLAIGLPIAWYLARTVSTGFVRYLSWSFLPLGGLTILLTGSRAGFASMMTALLIIPVSLRKTGIAMRVVLVGYLALAGVVVYLVTPTASRERIMTIESEVSSKGTIGERRRIWEAGLQTFNESPVVGIGAGAFLSHSVHYLPKRRVAHSSYISVLAETGVVGFSLFLGVFLALVLVLRKAEPDVRRTWLFALAALAAGAATLTWEYAKQPWIVVALALAHGYWSRAQAGTGGPMADWRKLGD
jgi:O-antigen ligase